MNRECTALDALACWDTWEAIDEDIASLRTKWSGGWQHPCGMFGGVPVVVKPDDETMIFYPGDYPNLANDPRQRLRHLERRSAELRLQFDMLLNNCCAECFDRVAWATYDKSIFDEEYDDADYSEAFDDATTGEDNDDDF